MRKLTRRQSQISEVSQTSEISNPQSSETSEVLPKAQPIHPEPQPQTSEISNRKQKWLKLIEFAVVGFATWLDPSAGFLIFLLKFCFQLLQTLQDDD